jgi:transglutaminase-like putative cysteine protease
MRVRILDETPRDLRWRGVALDEFTGKAWKKSVQARQNELINDRGGLFQFGTAQSIDRLTRQTFFLEPLESAVLFAAPRVVAVQGDLPFVRIDAEGSVQSRRRDFERIMYTAISETTEPRMDELRDDRKPYPISYYRYLQVPDDLDPRIETLATAVVLRANASNRYDIAKAIEAHLQTQYAYSLEMKAGGSDPLADFLFNVKAGHCEYYSTAMAVLLRSRGIAARVVNGFLPGEYNETAGAYTVRQSDAHSWVEVYFPETRSWVTFDPTPSAGRIEPVRTGVAAQLKKYAEALELLWFQYVVGYDKQEQRSLATSIHNQVFHYARVLSHVLETAKSYLTGNALVIAILLFGLATVLFVGLFGTRGWRWMRKGAISESEEGRTYSDVQFYERLISLMDQRGVSRDRHLTPLEFANNLKSNEAMVITRAYNRVRFGGQRLSASEKREVERALRSLEAADRNTD